MDPAIIVAITTTVGSVLLGVITLVVNMRNSRVSNTIAQTSFDQATRVEEWDRLLKNCRAENDRLLSEVNSYRERHRD